MPGNAFFAHVEVKRPFGAVDPRPQLATWCAAAHKKMVAHGWDLDIPTVAISVVGHEWSAYVVTWDADQKQVVSWSRLR